MVRIAQIGTGGWGKNHCRVLSSLEVLTAICDLNREVCDQFAETFGVEAFYSVEELINNHDFDAAVIATPTTTHYAIAAQLIRAGKHVFVEKPMTYKSDEGEKLVQLAEEENRLLTSGYIERFNPAVDQVKQYAQEKTYGDLLMLEFHRESRMPLHIKDVGIIYDTAVHDIDTALWLFHDTPETVYARSGKIRHHHEDFASIVLGFPNNRVAIIASNWITPVRIRTFNAIFTEGRIGGDFITRQLKIDTVEGTTIPTPLGGEPLLNELTNFVEAIQGKAELRVKAEHALNVTRIAEAAIKSTQTGRHIELEF
ncbi:MAG: Gfo/Idh/MocA family protein [Candidatus Kariarchaeaceae archaeon]|jgi:UDP-N-acetylglucosamine 3-dehydrogenase